LLITIAGLGGLLALTIAAEISEIARFPRARKLIG
jgi:transposase